MLNLGSAQRQASRQNAGRRHTPRAAVAGSEANAESELAELRAEAAAARAEAAREAATAQELRLQLEVRDQRVQELEAELAASVGGLGDRRAVRPGVASRKKVLRYAEAPEWEDGFDSRLCTSAIPGSEEEQAAKAAELQAELEEVQAQLANAKESAAAIEAQLAELIEARRLSEHSMANCEGDSVPSTPRVQVPPESPLVTSSVPGTQSELEAATPDVKEHQQPMQSVPVEEVKDHPKLAQPTQDSRDIGLDQIQVVQRVQAPRVELHLHEAADGGRIAMVPDGGFVQHVPESTSSPGRPLPLGPTPPPGSGTYFAVSLSPKVAGHTLVRSVTAPQNFNQGLRLAVPPQPQVHLARQRSAMMPGEVSPLERSWRTSVVATTMGHMVQRQQSAILPGELSTRMAGLLNSGPVRRPLGSPSTAGAGPSDVTIRTAHDGQELLQQRGGFRPVSPPAPQPYFSSSGHLSEAPSPSSGCGIHCGRRWTPAEAMPGADRSKASLSPRCGEPRQGSSGPTTTRMSPVVVPPGAAGVPRRSQVHRPSAASAGEARARGAEPSQSVRFVAVGTRPAAEVPFPLRPPVRTWRA